MAKKKTSSETKVESIRHKDKRKNIPTEELRKVEDMQCMIALIGKPPAPSRLHRPPGSPRLDRNLSRASRVPERLGTIAESWQAPPDEPIPRSERLTFSARLHCQSAGPAPFDAIRSLLKCAATSLADSAGCRFNTSTSSRSVSTFITFGGTSAICSSPPDCWRARLARISVTNVAEENADVLPNAAEPQTKSISSPTSLAAPSARGSEASCRISPHPCVDQGAHCRPLDPC